MNTLNNRVQLIGNVGNTPEITVLESGKKMAKFSMATNHHYTNSDGEKVTDTQWHNIVAWGTNAELVENYVPKGKSLVLEGRLSNRSYEDKEGGKRYVTEVICQQLQLM